MEERSFEKCMFGLGILTAISVLLWMLIASLEHGGMFIYYYEPNAIIYGVEVFLFVIGITACFKFFVDLIIRKPIKEEEKPIKVVEETTED